jgi:hypothetical protein
MKETKKNQLPKNIDHVIKELKAMSETGQINFAFAFAYPDAKGQYQLEAHTGGAINILKALFKDDTNAEALAKLNLEKEQGTGSPYYFSTPTSPHVVTSVRDYDRVIDARFCRL